MAATPSGAAGGADKTQLEIEMRHALGDAPELSTTLDGPISISTLKARRQKFITHPIKMVGLLIFLVGLLVGILVGLLTGASVLYDTTSLTPSTSANTPQAATTEHVPAALRTQAQLPETELEEEKAAAAEAEDYGAAKKLREEFGRLTEQTLRGEQHANGEQKGKPVQFIHIGKTGGSSIISMLREDDTASCTETNNHRFVLGDGPAGTRYVFFVRDPVDRWVSGFLSRLRQGCPNYPHVGHRDELIAFYDFPTPDSLARALSTEKGQRANAAIRHTRRSFSSYLAKIEKHVHDIAFVGRMNKMTRDYNAMLKHIIPHWNKTRPEGVIPI
jgi:hypothetical protein